MPSPVGSNSKPSFLSPATRRRRLALIGAICIFAFASSSLYSSLANSRSIFGGQSPATTVHSFGMEGTSSTVPSIVVYVTVPNKEAGKKLAESIVKEKLAACVNRIPGIESVYQWKGEIQTDSEELLIIKTRQSLLEALTEHVKANHEYEKTKECGSIDAPPLDPTGSCHLSVMFLVMLPM